MCLIKFEVWKYEAYTSCNKFGIDKDVKILINLIYGRMISIIISRLT